jgi:hypothetical protein
MAAAGKAGGKMGVELHEGNSDGGDSSREQRERTQQPGGRRAAFKVANDKTPRSRDTKTPSEEAGWQRERAPLALAESDAVGLDYPQLSFRRTLPQHRNETS